jgi:hypothetical protein
LLLLLVLVIGLMIDWLVVSIVMVWYLLVGALNVLDVMMEVESWRAELLYRILIKHTT